MNEKAFTKMKLARTEMILSHPFWASLALNLELKEDYTKHPIWTDSQYLGYNPDYVLSISNAEIIAVIVHEIYHVMLGHPFRMKHRNETIWNEACDYAINPFVIANGYILPGEILYDEQFAGMSAERIYQILIKEQESNNQANKENNAGSSRNDPSSNSSYLGSEYANLPGGIIEYKAEYNESSISHQEQKWKGRLAQATVIGKAKGKVPLEMQRMIQDILEPQLPWQEILSRFVTENSRNDYSWKLPNPRYLPIEIYLPKLDTPEVGKVAVIIDTSGSINQNQLDSYAAELRSILMIYPKAEAFVMYVDYAIANIETLTADNLEFHAKGGGGTDYKPGFEYLEQNNVDVSCIIYFSDGYCDSFPENFPNTPTLWVINGNQKFQAPFGEVIFYRED